VVTENNRGQSTVRLGVLYSVRMKVAQSEIQTASVQGSGEGKGEIQRENSRNWASRSWILHFMRYSYGNFVLQLIVVTTCEYPINLFTNPNPVYKSLIHVKILYFSLTYIKFQCLYDSYSLSRHIHLSDSNMFRAHTAIIRYIIKNDIIYMPVSCRTGQRFYLHGEFWMWILSCSLVCHFFLYKCHLYSMFRLYKFIIRWIISCNCFFFLIRCSKSWLKLIPIMYKPVIIL
jgi:hypothetical protein